MTASSTVVIQNLAYLVGAIVLAIIIGLIVWLRHRPPRSVESNVESFHRGLRALAPDDRRPMSRPVGLRIQPPHATEPDAEEAEEADETEEAAAAEEPEPVAAEGEPVDEAEKDAPVDLTDDEVVPASDDAADAAEVQPDASAHVVDLPKQEADGAGAGEATGDWAGAETG